MSTLNSDFISDLVITRAHDDIIVEKTMMSSCALVITVQVCQQFCYHGHTKREVIK